MLAEKAYAKLYGSFSAIIGGSEAEALQDLTGGLPSRIGIGGEQAEPRFKGSGAAEEAWTLLNSLLDEGAVVCCSRQADAIRRGIIPNHAYGILRALEVRLVGGKSAKLVQVRNPWGRGLEWDGAWSDADSSWTRVAPESQRLLGRNVGTGQQVSDGTWWMTVADWQANFHRLECCRHLELLPEWTVHAVVGEWQPESTETGQWHLFPQYHLQAQRTDPATPPRFPRRHHRPFPQPGHALTGGRRVPHGGLSADGARHARPQGLARHCADADGGPAV